MRIEKVTVHYARKLGDPRPGHYGSVDNGVVLEAALEEGDDYEAVMQELHDQAQAAVKDFSLEWMGQVTRDMADVFEHLPADVQASITNHLHRR